MPPPKKLYKRDGPKLPSASSSKHGKYTNKPKKKRKQNWLIIGEQIAIYYFSLIKTSIKRNHREKISATTRSSIRR